MPIVIPLVAALPDLLFVLLIIVLGTGLAFFIVPPLVDILRKLPLVGDWIATAVWIAFLAQQTALRGWMARNVDPVVNFFQSALSIIGGWLGLYVKFMGATVNAMIATAQAAGGQAGNVGARIIALAGRVLALETAQGGLTDFVNGLWNRVTNVIQVIIPTAVGTAVQALQQLLHVGLTIEHTAMTVAVGQAMTVASQLFHQAELAAHAGDLVLSELLAHTAATLAAEIVAVQTGAKIYTDGMVRQLQGEIGTITGVIIPVAVGTLTAEIEGIATHIDQLERECINPACSALGAGLDLFSLLQQGIELLMMVTLVGAAISDPERTGHELAAGVDELLDWVRPIVGAFGVHV